MEGDVLAAVFASMLFGPQRRLLKYEDYQVSL
jgi:hypothetical protein